jgi:hypothetical protein
MLASLRARSLLLSLLALTCAAAVFAACGGSKATEAAGSASSASGGATSAGPTSSGHGTGGHGTGGGGIDFDAGNGVHTLTVSPKTATLTITNGTTPETQTFEALLDGSPVTSGVTWTLDSYAQGSISAAGGFTTTGLVGGLVNVTATYGKEVAKAQLTVDVKIVQTVLQGAMDPGPSAQNTTALMGAPMPDPGAALTPPNPTAILYPYNKTVFPRGLVAPRTRWCR